MSSFSSAIIAQNPTQTSLDDLIQAVGDAADKEWYEAALRAVEHVCLNRDTFTVDDIHTHLDRFDVHTKDTSALGAVMREAKKKRWCAPLQSFQPSGRTERHGSPVRIWRSLLFLSSNSYQF